MKNIVFMPAIKDKKRIGRSGGYEWSIKSWKYWCKKNDCELFILNDLLLALPNCVRSYIKDIFMF